MTIMTTPITMITTIMAVSLTTARTMITTTMTITITDHSWKT